MGKLREKKLSKNNKMKMIFLDKNYKTKEMNLQ